MNEHQAVLLAAGTWIGVWTGAGLQERFAWSLPVTVAIAVVGAAVVAGRPRPLILAALVLAASVGARAERQHVVADVQRYEGVVRLVNDPRSFGVGASVEVRLDTGRRVRLVLAPPIAWEAEAWSAGQAISVQGHVAPLEQTAWTRARHLVGTLRVEEARLVGRAPWWMQPSEWLRSTVSSAARGFEPDLAALYTGLVIGDDRDQSMGQQARFRTAGLSHLLAVSGQNVAFVLLVVSPVFRLLGTRGRVVAVAVVLAAFGLATRFEPSVLRATFTAGIAAGAIAAGRRASGIHLLALAVSGLVLIDPFLVHSLGFRLSVAASAGILLLAPALSRRFAGPRVVREVLAVTVAAQLAVLPLLFVFGPVSGITVLANVLAGWAAGLVMAWGMSVGLILAQFPRWSVLQAPAEALVWWVDRVAAWASRAPAPVLTPPRVVVLVAVGLALWSTMAGPSTVRRSVLFRAAAWCGWVAVLASFVPRTPTDPVILTGGRYWPGGEAGPSVLVVTGTDGDELLGQLAEVGVRSVDLVVLERGDRTARATALAVVDQLRPGLVLAPFDHVVAGASGLGRPATVEVAGDRLRIAPQGRRLTVSTE